MKRLLILCASLLILTQIPLQQAFGKKNVVDGGPNDYYEPDPWIKTYLTAVETHHLLPVQEMVKKGYTTSDTGGRIRDIWEEIDFTLRWFPNHPEGLRFMAQWLPRYPHPPNKGVIYYFEKAIQYKPTSKWRPVDAVARQLYAMYLHKSGKYDEAEKLYLSALEIAPNNAEIHYNIGLLYCAKKEYEKALPHAQTAYKLGYPLPGLRNMLIKAGTWKEEN